MGSFFYSIQTLSDIRLPNLIIQSQPITYALLLIISLLLTFSSSKSNAETIDRSKLIKIEAAYLYKFTKFIQWPDYRFQENSDLNICLIGKNLTPLNNLLDRGVSGKSSNGHPLNVFHYIDLPNDKLANDQQTKENAIKKCHLIYLDTASINDLKIKLDKPSTLIISSPNNETTEDSLLSLQINQGKLVFFVNQNHLDKSLLEFNATLLSLARKQL